MLSTEGKSMKETKPTESTVLQKHKASSSHETSINLLDQNQVSKNTCKSPSLRALLNIPSHEDKPSHCKEQVEANCTENKNVSNNIADIGGKSKDNTDEEKQKTTEITQTSVSTKNNIVQQYENKSSKEHCNRSQTSESFVERKLREVQANNSSRQSAYTSHLICDKQEHISAYMR